MTHFTAEQWILIITAISTAICSIIAALKSSQGKKLSDEIKKVTNGNHQDVKADLEAALKRERKLNKIVAKMASKSQTDILTEAIAELDHEEALVGKRRKSDR